MTTWRDAAEVSVVWVQADGDDVRAVCVIDGRDYADERTYRAALNDAFQLLDERGVLDQIESFRATEFAVPQGLPPWETYRATLGE